MHVIAKGSFVMDWSLVYEAKGQGFKYNPMSYSQGAPSSATVNTLK